MEQMNHAYQGVLAAAEAGDVGQAVEKAKTIHALLDTVKTYEDAEDFKTFASGVQEQLQEAVEAGPGEALAQYQAVAAACDKCHQVYRKGHEEHEHEHEAEPAAEQEEPRAEAERGAGSRHREEHAEHERGEHRRERAGQGRRSAPRQQQRHGR